MSECVNVFFARLPVNECITRNDDDSYSVFINEDLCEQKKIRAYRHALNHIAHDDFSNEIEADSIELTRHESD